MDVSVLPNNNHPDKFLQLDVGMLGALHFGALMSSQRRWQNKVYLQRNQILEAENQPGLSQEGSPVTFADRYLQKHITPITLKSNIKKNPLYVDIMSAEAADNDKCKPCWTIRDYDTQTIHGNLADYFKGEEKMPKDLDFWLEDLYTPGFDSLLKKKEAEHRRKKVCRILSSVIFLVCGVLIIIIVPVVFVNKSNW
ncbi:major intrinsically disordered NOTCH2-binding receptor 1-like [Cololabis saira]|uniref:major intrinsically disordered NOTCH2-binding receptor 1-like n=1 Tax=Cololabis saira TaxID=129043 RepID=UPI002AD469FB|nr:major intrinsically disordered NOTCH2-binding receptor 1-like [Cololabis saira]